MTTPEPLEFRTDPPSGTTLDGRDVASLAASLAHTAHREIHRLEEHPRLRSAVLLQATATYNAWLLRWPPGTRVTPHDHGDSVGAFTVIEGELAEIRWAGPGRRRVQVVLPGPVIPIESGVVHDVVATATTPSLSVHVYSPPLAAMGFYDEDGGDLVDWQRVDHTRGTIADPRALHPAGRG